MILVCGAMHAMDGDDAPMEKKSENPSAMTLRFSQLAEDESSINVSIKQNGQTIEQKVHMMDVRHLNLKVSDLDKPEIQAMLAQSRSDHAKHDQKAYETEIQPCVLPKKPETREEWYARITRRAEMMAVAEEKHKRDLLAQSPDWFDSRVKRQIEIEDEILRIMKMDPKPSGSEKDKLMAHIQELEKEMNAIGEDLLRNHFSSADLKKRTKELFPERKEGCVIS